MGLSIIHISFSDSKIICNEENSVPLLVNTIFAVIGELMETKNILITDFKNNTFTKAFKKYFHELGINVSDWNALWEEMNCDTGNIAYVKTNELGEAIGFIQFKSIELNNCFFIEKFGFIREFWIAKEYRGNGFGKQLLNDAESFFKQNGITQVLLTTDTAEGFYVANGYAVNQNITAKNNLTVMIKSI